MSYILSRFLIKRAVDIVRPTILKILGSYSVDKRLNLHLVVLEPNTPEILYEESFGDKTKWQKPYDQIALSKARLCQRTSMVTRNVQNDAPWLYEGDDTRYVGGVIENGLVVSASGLQDYFDEMISWMVLSAIQALCREFIAKISENDMPDFYK